MFKKYKWNKPALVVGLFVATMHAIWALSVALGVGQMYLNWIFPLHFLNNLYIVSAFNLFTALVLVLVAFVVSYISTLLFVWLWKVVKVKQK
ncbi:MAG: hypothetical protein AABX99_03355 [Nanoarchaeota archaeon]